MPIYIAQSKEEFITAFEENYALHQFKLYQLRDAVSHMTSIRLVNPEIQPWPGFDSDDIEEIADEVFSRLHCNVQ